MPHYSQSKCTACGNDFPKELLVAMTVSFTPVGIRGKVLKSRTPDWFCPECLEVNAYWNIPSHQAPGMKSAGLEHVRSVMASRVKP